MKTNTVLFVGGPNDGMRVLLSDFSRFVIAPAGLPESDDSAQPAGPFPTVHYQLSTFRGEGGKYTCYIATLGTDPRDPMQIMFEEYGKAGA